MSALQQSVNRSNADWIIEKQTLMHTDLDGNLSSEEKEFTNFDVVFGGGYEATVYTRSNATHIYFGVEMDNYTLGEDAFGLQVAPMDSTQYPDVRIVNYEGHDAWDGYIDYKKEWVEDSSGVNEYEFSSGENVIEFVLPLDTSDPDDQSLLPGMNYQLRFLWWNNVNTGEPTFSSDWKLFWVPITLF